MSARFSSHRSFVSAVLCAMLHAAAALEGALEVATPTTTSMTADLLPVHSRSLSDFLISRPDVTMKKPSTRPSTRKPSPPPKKKRRPPPKTKRRPPPKKSRRPPPKSKGRAPPNKKRRPPPKKPRSRAVPPPGSASSTPSLIILDEIPFPEVPEEPSPPPPKEKPPPDATPATSRGNMCSAGSLQSAGAHVVAGRRRVTTRKSFRRKLLAADSRDTTAAFFVPCRSAITGAADCCESCRGDSSCEGWFTTSMDCSRWGGNPSVEVCYTIADALLEYRDRDSTGSLALFD